MSSLLDRFLDAQDDTYDDALEEIRNGRKDSHWMWFVFPQIAGLGESSMARRYAIADLQEAADYLAHPLLGHRLIECTEAALKSPESIINIFGRPDHMKFRSCMTLFASASAGDSVFKEALQKKCGGVHDAATLQILRTQKHPATPPAAGAGQN
jgi:uncharacterized protein (DUF1810 family)